MPLSPQAEIAISGMVFKHIFNNIGFARYCSTSVLDEYGEIMHILHGL
jgi:hypothetical protein